MARNTKHKARHNKSLFSCGSKWWWSRSKRRKLTIFGAKRQILMNNPRVHSQTAQNLNVKKGLIRHHQRLEITMTREAFYQPSKFESVQYFCQYLHICTYEVTGNKLKCATWHLADWPRCTGRIWSLWLAVLESETEDYFSIDSSSPRAWYNLPSLCAPLLEEQVLVWYRLLICWGKH